MPVYCDGDGDVDASDGGVGDSDSDSGHAPPRPPIPIPIPVMSYHPSIIAITTLCVISDALSPWTCDQTEHGNHNIPHLSSLA
jgi:hypothetical protein